MTESNITINFTTEEITINFSGGVSTGATSLTAHEYTGEDLDGNDGDINRYLELANVIFIIVDNMFLHSNVNYTYTDNTITFLQPIWNSQKITVYTT